MSVYRQVCCWSIATFFVAAVFASDLRAADPPTAKDLALSLQAAFADAIERAEPSLVSVARLRLPDGRIAHSLPDPLMNRRFAIQLQQEPIHRSWTDSDDPNWMPQDYGSGVVIDSAGFILTNHHVVDGAEKVRVVLHTGKVLEADIWAADPRSDLAVVRVEAKGLRAIRLGDASKVKKGHIVLALGNPLAMARDGRSSASWGIIANIARRFPPPPVSPTGEPEELTLHHNGTLFQTDARLNYGASGGALLNLDGEMIGLVTALAAVRGYDQGAGYAIPMDEMTRRILGVLRDGREVEYGFLGIRPVDYRATDADAETTGMPKEGARIEQVFAGSPAYQSGLQPNDVIISIDGAPVRNREELVLTVGTRFAGSTVPFILNRDGKRTTVPVTLGKYPVGGRIYAENRPKPWRGVRVDYVTVLMTNSINAQTRLSEVPDGGVLVTHVESESPAARAQLEANTIITHVGSTRVRNPIEFQQAVLRLKGTVELTTDEGKVPVPAE